MSYVKLAKQLKEAAGDSTIRQSTHNVRSMIDELMDKPGISKQDLVLAMGYSVHYCDYEDAIPAQTALMLAFEDMTNTAKPNPTSSFIAGSSLSENLKHIRDALKDEMSRIDTNVMDKGGMIARAVYEAPSDGAQSAILTVVEALSRDWGKERSLSR